ncbi:unnamed protein product [Cylicocyclus nassatus]|uniref:Uncharacterized protein n=1 Tax=Cylicocyclus nassatus TaxID=53992 RepID=A0AA36DSC3_CYLNA|nr:unnamed protein product [Cylicocyclus nassatus]
MFPVLPLKGGGAGGMGGAGGTGDVGGAGDVGGTGGVDNTGRILDYLRDKDHFFPPSDENAREALRREAEFYKLNDLVLMCLPDGFAVGDVVKWKENAIESYWKFFAMSLLRKSMDCFECGEKLNEHSRTRKIKIDFDCWEHLRHHMRFMEGGVIEVLKPCLSVQWLGPYNYKPVHIPRSAIYPDKYYDYVTLVRKFAPYSGKLVPQHTDHDYGIIANRTGHNLHAEEPSKTSYEVVITILTVELPKPQEMTLLDKI